jgi:hypothetical protein
MKYRIKEIPKNRRMQEQIKERGRMSLAILAGPMLQRRYETLGE